MSRDKKKQYKFLQKRVQIAIKLSFFFPQININYK